MLTYFETGFSPSKPVREKMLLHSLPLVLQYNVHSKGLVKSSMQVHYLHPLSDGCGDQKAVSQEKMFIFP